jgi:hypothetical protein
MDREIVHRDLKPENRPSAAEWAELADATGMREEYLRRVLSEPEERS